MSGSVHSAVEIEDATQIVPEHLFDAISAILEGRAPGGDPQKCIHHWILGSSQRGIMPASCKKCGAAKDMPLFVPTPWDDPYRTGDGRDAVGLEEVDGSSDEELEIIERAAPYIPSSGSPNGKAETVEVEGEVSDPTLPRLLTKELLADIVRKAKERQKEHAHRHVPSTPLPLTWLMLEDIKGQTKRKLGW